MNLDHHRPTVGHALGSRRSALGATRRRARASLVGATLLLAATAAAEPARPVRVATLLPFVADALQDVPDRAVVVASVRRSLAEPPAPGVADLGSPHSPSFEKLAESRPDVVVAERAMHAALVEKLGRSGGEVLLVDTSSVDETLAGLRALGKRVNAAEEMDRAVARTKEEIRSQTLAKPLPTLAIFGVPGSFLLITDRTWLGDLLGELRFENAAAAPAGNERFPGYVELSDELLAGLGPEIVLLVAHGDPDAIRAALAKRIDEDGAWSSIRETANRGVHVLDGEVFGTNPGLEMAEAARELRRLAQGEVASGRSDVPQGAGSQARSDGLSGTAHASGK
jgi:iron complex transport system substrate-binding protein